MATSLEPEPVQSECNLRTKVYFIRCVMPCEPVPPAPWPPKKQSPQPLLEKNVLSNSLVLCFTSLSMGTVEDDHTVEPVVLMYGEPTATALQRRYGMLGCI